MLNVYTDLAELGDTILIRVNDMFFDTETNLSDNDIVRKIMKTIDKADYNSNLTFVGRTKKLGALNKSMLSTGTKTLLNILEHPDICFDLCECGNNALSLLPLIRQGNVYWEYPAVAYDGDADCDICCRGRHFSNFYDFLESVGDSV